jgi:hypothetical protein
MTEPKSWFLKAKDSLWKKKHELRPPPEASAARDGGKAFPEEIPSTITRQKVAAAKQYIENHYKSQMKILQDRHER